MKTKQKRMLKKIFMVLIAVALLLSSFVAYGVIETDVHVLSGVDISCTNEKIEAEHVEIDHIGSKLVRADVSIVEEPDLDNVVEEPVEEVVEVIEEVTEPTIEERILEKCEEYGVPYDVGSAIARLETGWFKGKAFVEGNNPGGLSRNEKPIYFDSIEEGVDAFVSNLANNYFGIGLCTVEQIGAKYCPVNPDWANLVRSVM